MKPFLFSPSKHVPSSAGIPGVSGQPAVTDATVARARAVALRTFRLNVASMHAQAQPRRRKRASCNAVLEVPQRVGNVCARQGTMEIVATTVSMLTNTQTQDPLKGSVLILKDPYII